MHSTNRILFCFLMILIALLLTQCSSKSSEEWVREGIVLSEKGDYKNAFDAFMQATELDSKNSAAHYGLGGMYNYQGRHEEARQSFQTVIKLDPTHINARYSLGFTYEKLEKPELAKAEFARYHSLKNRFEAMVAKEQEKP